MCHEFLIDTEGCNLVRRSYILRPTITDRTMPLKSIQLGGVYDQGSDISFPKLTGTARYRGTKRMNDSIMHHQVGWHREQNAPRPNRMRAFFVFLQPKETVTMLEMKWIRAHAEEVQAGTTGKKSRSTFAHC